MKHRSIKTSKYFDYFDTPKIRLSEAVSTGSKTYEEIFIQQKYGLLDILEVVPSLRLTPVFIVQKCSTIMPRYYTIASSSLAHPNEIAIAISLSTIELASGKQRDGLASGYLNDIFKRMQAGETVTASTMAFVNSSNFVLAADHQTPLIMVGPGTGVVPYIGIMQERNKAKSDNPELALGPAAMYFGCRQHDSDYIYRDEMTDFLDRKVIDSLNVALSRPTEAGAKR